MTKEVIVIGAGGFGREALDVIEAHNAARPDDALVVIGVADDGPSDLNLERLRQRGVRYLGSIEQAWQGQIAHSVVAVGSPKARQAIVIRLTEMGVVPLSVCHPSAIIGSQASLGEGHVICAGVVVSTNVRLGKYVHLNPGAVIGHDTEIGNYVSVNPNATVSGECDLGVGALVGAGAVILQGLSLGHGITVGASACVTKNFPENVTVVGVPAHLSQALDLEFDC